MKINSNISHKKLAEQLSIDDLALIMLHKSNSDCNYDTSEKKLLKFNKTLTYLLENFNDFIKFNKQGFIFRACLNNSEEQMIKNIDSLFELINEKKGIKRKYLNLNYYTTEHLILSGLLIQEGSDYNSQVLFSTKQLEDLISPFLDENNRCDFSEVTNALIIYLTKYFHNLNIELKDRR